MHRQALLALTAAVTATFGSITLAGPYAGTIIQNGGTVTFRIGENADDVTVIRDGTPTSLGAQNRGSVSFDRQGAANYQIVVKKNNTTLGYQTVIDQNLNGGQKFGLLGLTNLISDDSTFLQMERPVGLAINRNPATPNLFGRIYIANPRAIATGTGRNVQDGVYVVNPDYTETFAGQGDTPLTGGIAFDTASSTSPWKLSLDDEGFVYIGDWSDTVGTVYRASPDVGAGTGTNLLTGSGGTTPFIPTAIKNHGSSAAMVIRGSATAGNLTLFSLEEDLSPDGTAAGVQGLWRFDLGTTTAGFSGVPTPSPNPFLKTQGVQEYISQSPKTGRIYAGQSRFNGQEGCLFVFSPDGSQLRYNSLEDSILLNQDGFLDGAATVSLGINDALRSSVGSAISSDDRWMATCITNGGDAWVIPLIDGIPDLPNRILIDAFAGNTCDTVEFDAAGNLYVGNRTNEIVRIFTPGEYSETTYNSNGTFTYRNMADYNGTGNYTDSTKWLNSTVVNGNDAFVLVGNVVGGKQTLTLDTGVAAGILRFGGGNYTVAGTQTLTMGAGFVEPRIIAEAGNQTINAPISVQKNFGVGAYAGSTLTLTNVNYGAATLNTYKFGAGTVTMPAVKGALMVIRDGTLKVPASGTANAASGLTVAKKFVVSGPEAAPFGRLDLTNNSMVIDYTSPDPSPLPNVRALLLAGYNAGGWNGNGLVSSTAAASPSTGKTALGYRESLALLGVGGGVYAGQTVDDTAVIVKYTYAGDGTLDGQVDITDLGALATAWQTAGNWESGDFNYDNFIDITDLGLLATNWQQGVGSPLGPDSLGAALASFGLPNVSVPEPASLGVLALAMLGARMRRR